MTDAELRSTVEDSLRSYCRGIDRLHAPSIAAAFHPEAALIDYGPDPLTIEAFAAYAVTALQRRFVATQHRISNITVERTPSGALVETYVHATHVEDSSNGRRLHTFVGRYIDRFEIRDGVCKIAHRTLRNDWTRVEAITEAMSGTYVASGRGDTTDPIWG